MPAVTDLPFDRIAQATQPTPAQRSALDELKDVATNAAERLISAGRRSCLRSPRSKILDGSAPSTAASREVHSRGTGSRRSGMGRAQVSHRDSAGQRGGAAPGGVGDDEIAAFITA